MATLKVSAGGNTWKVALGELTTIGRDTANQISLADSFVSRNHAEIRRRKDDTYQIVDLNTPNGTYVAGKRTQSTALSHGDEIRVGSARLRFEEQDGFAGSTEEVTLVRGGMEGLTSEWVSFEGDPRYPPSEQVEDAATLRLPYEKLRMANTLSRAIYTASDLSTLMEQILDTCLNLFRADRAAVLLVDPETSQVTRRVARRRNPGGGGVHVPDNVIEQVLARRCGVVSSDEDRTGLLVDEEVGRPIQSLMCAPMLHHGTAQGALYLDGTEPRMFGAVELEILGGVAAQAAVAVSDTLLAERVSVLESRQRDQLEALISALPDAVLLLDREHRITVANQRAHDLLSALAPSRRKDILTELGDVPIEQLIERARSGQQEIVIERPTRRIFSVLVPAVPAESELHTVLIIRDITDERKQQWLGAQQERLAVVGQLSAGVAHEINNPLTYVMANLDFVANELPELCAHIPDEIGAELTDAIREAREGADRIRRIVHELKVFSRPDQSHIGPVDLKRSLENTVQLLHNEIRHRAKLVTDYAATRRALAERGRLEHVFLNLLVNATQVLPVGKAERNTIKVATRDLDADRVLIEISDSGPGIPPEIRTRIFDPFFTTRTVGEGTGLGLFVCHNILKGLSGEVSADDAPGGGATFRVTLPAVLSEHELSTKGVAIDEQRRQVRILIVDDEVLVAASLSRWLRQHDVQTAYGGAQAFQMCEENDFDVVLCDLMMPEMTGMELHEKIRAELPHYEERMIFMTGGAFTPQAAEFLDTMSSRRLDKPINRSVLNSTIEEMAARRRTGSL